MDISNQEFNSTESMLTEKMRTWLSASAKWARFLSIVGFVFIGLCSMTLFSLGSILSTLNSQQSIPPMLLGLESFMIFPFLLIIVTYFFPTLYLFQFSLNTLKGIASYDAQKLEIGLEKLKSFFKFIGIFTIIIISIYGLAILIIVAGITNR